MNLTIAAKVAEDVAVVGAAVGVALTQSHDPATVLTVAASAPAVRGVLASLISKGQERSFVGAVKLVYGLIAAVTAKPAPAAGDEAAAAEEPTPTAAAA